MQLVSIMHDAHADDACTSLWLLTSCRHGDACGDNIVAELGSEMAKKGNGGGGGLVDPQMKIHNDNNFGWWDPQ
jgi:hypothetical protein